jgi:hypothetical protein
MENDPAAPPRAGGSAPAERSGGWAASALLFVALTAIYLCNRRQAIGSNDTFAAEYLPLAILRGDGPVLDRFARVWAPAGRPPPTYMARSRGHLVSRYPVAPALLLVPLEAPQVWYYDRIDPGWDLRVRSTSRYCQRMAKRASAVIVALAAAFLHQLLRRIGLGRVALPATLTAALGSDLWTVASQAPWQHGPAALALVLTLLLLLPEREPSRPRLALAGLTAALMVAFRPLDLLLAAVIFGWVARRHTRRLAWFLPGPVVIGAALVAWNLWWFGAIEGGQRALEGLHPRLHDHSGIFSGDLREGAAGTLFSPSRGLFVFCPWVAVALAVLPAVIGRLRARPPAGWLAAALVPYFLLLSKYSVWWAGHSFGPRYWTDVIPIFAILLALGLDWARERCTPVLYLFGITILLAIAVQAIGAFCYPSTWNLQPGNVDRHHDRLWDWSDSELTRCLREGVKPW